MSVETTAKLPLIIDDDDFQNLPITLTALINDTTGTLIASHYVNPRTKIACIFGTGCNAAYMERASAIEKIESLGIDPNAEMVINCEWVNCRVLASNRGPHPLVVFQGAFDSFEHEHLPRTKYDAIVDETSNKPGEQAFEVRSQVFDVCICLLASFMAETYFGQIFGGDTQIGHL